MASVLLRRQLARNISFANRRLFASTSSVLAQAAPQGQTATTLGSKNTFNKHIAEDLQGVSASEILAESGTRKDAQMRHFTGEDIFVSPQNPMTDHRSPVNFG
jgi:NADH dehydrogenase (ubiquinone) Fe-S protein 2